MTRLGCPVCTRVDTFDLINLDALMGDPTAWPASVWGPLFTPPSGNLPASYRRFGAIEMGMVWLKDHGFTDISRGRVRQHYRYDVPKIGTDPEDLIRNGLIRRGEKADISTLNPLAYLDYYNTGIRVGVQGLKLLEQRIQLLLDAKAEVPLALIKMAVDSGSKLAMSQAAIRAAGRPWGQDDDADEGFRAAAAPLPSPRMGHTRIRVIDGEARPVTDMGPADRADYAERAAQDGSTPLPHR